MNDAVRLVVREGRRRRSTRRCWQVMPLAAVVSALILTGCAPPEPQTPPPSTTIVPDDRAERLAQESVEDFVPGGVVLAASPQGVSVAGLVGGSDERRVWIFDAPTDAAATVAGQELLAFAVTDGWTIESQGADPGLAGSWDGTATKEIPQGRLRLEVFAVSAGYATQKGDAPEPFVQVQTTLEAR